MIIDFQSIDETAMHRADGQKSVTAHIFNDGKNKIMFAKLEPGDSNELHRHETSSEVLYILKGRGKMLCDGEYEELLPGKTHYCPKGHEHRMTNDGNEDLIFLAVIPEQ